MTEEEVVNVRGEEISENGHDHIKIKAEHCNGDARFKKKDENGNVGATEVGGEIGAAVVDSSASDPIFAAVDVNGSKDREVDGESRVKITEGEHECEVVDSINNKENSCEVSNGSVEGTCETTTADVVEREAESGIVDSRNGSGSAVVSGDEKGVIDSVAEGGEEFRIVQNGVSDREVSESAVDDMIREEVEGVTVQDHELASVEVVGVSDDQNGVVAENEICADVDVSKDVAADVDKSDSELEVEAVENGTVESAVEMEIPVVVEGVAASTEVNEVVSDKDHESVERENVVSEDVELDSVGGVDVSQHAAEKDVDVNVSECTEENNVPVDGELSIKLEKSGGESGIEEVPEIDMVGDVAVVTEGEPSVDTCSAVENEDEPSNDVKGEGEPSNAVKNEAEPSQNAVQGEAESSIDMRDLKTGAVESEAEYEDGREAEPSNNVVESEAEPSDSSVLGEAGSSVDVPDMKTDAVENESEPLVEAEPSAESSNQADEDLRPTQEGSAADALNAESMATEVVKRPFYYLIRVPRYDDVENFKEKIKIALQQVDEKTKLRDAFRGETQTKKAICKEYGQAVRDAMAEERAALDLLKSKRQEMDSVQSTMNRLNTVISVGDIDGKIRNMEHMIQHETLLLKEEKQLIRQIKQLKQNREELSANIGKEDQSQSVDNIEEHSKQLQLLRKELDVLRNNVMKTEAVTKAARKKYDEECNKLSELMSRFKAADNTRQEAYVKLQTLKKQLHEKSKYFWEYKNAATKAHELAAQRKKEELQSFCIDQDERIKELWNNNDEFRRNYVRCNTRSTLRRLQTLDGRSLGPDEEPPVIPNAFNERGSKNDSLVSRSAPEQENKSISTEPVIKDEPVSKVVVQKTEGSQTAKAKKPAKPAPLKKSAVTGSRRWGDESDEDIPEEPVRTKEEEEQILKAEKARKEEEAEKLKEMRRLEEIEKAKEALQRKKRNAEKAQQRAAYKAQKEAEQKEKERERRARKKDKRKATSTDEVADTTEQDSAPSTEILTRATEEPVQSEKPVEVTKRPQKPSQFIKQNKVKSLPMAIRNRGKRRIQPWMWVLIAVLVVIILFYMGNNGILRSSLQSFGF